LDEDQVDDVLKNLASKFNASNDGELHFIEFTNDGEIFPNFSNIRSQKFEGKLAGNYSLTLKQSDYETGIHRINQITKTVTRKTAISVSDETHEGVNIEIPIETTEQNMTDDANKKNSYSDDFKREVAEAARKSGATLASVGEKFGVSPTLVRNWKIKFSEAADNPKTAENNKPKLSAKAIQSWIQNSIIEGTVDGDGDLYVSLETSADSITEAATKLFITGTQKLASGGKNETTEISDQLTTNETNWLRSDFLKGVGSDNTQFSYNLNCDVYGCSDKVIVPIKLKKGKVSECPIKAGQLELSELNFIFEDGDFRAEGTIKGPNGFIYAAEVLTEEPEEGHVPSANKTPDDENSADMYEFLWDVKKGATVYVVLCAFEKLDGKLSCGFTGEAQVDEPVSYDEDDVDTDDFEGPDVDDVETDEGDIGLFEFQIKRGLVDEDEIDDEDVQNLIDELKQLCEDENYEGAANLLLSNLSLEFGPDQLDDGPERFFANTDYIEFECTSENTSVKIGYDDCLVVTISVQFEIPLNAGISTLELAEYLPASGAWASASASPGWGYSGSDGDNVWFLGIKGKIETFVSNNADESEAIENQLGSNNSNLKINAGWERRDAKYICRWIIVWEEMKNGSLAGALGGYSGGGVFQMEQFYAEHSSGRLTSLMIDIEDKITKNEIDFWNDRPKEAGTLCDSAQDEIMAWHDEDTWEDWEQLVLLDAKRTNLVEEGDLLLLSTDKSPFVKEILELAGITAAPK
jgi:hypothetical protein